MTIQCLMSNKGSLILASDLAVTMEDNKSYVGVKKIFKLDNNIPLGIMINGSVEFEEVPLETVIGEFKNMGKNFKSVCEVKNDFIEFLSKNTEYTPIHEYIMNLITPFKKQLKTEINQYGFDSTINSKNIREIPIFIKNLSNFNNEFYNLIPPEYDKINYNLKIWEIFSYELQYEGSGIIFAGFDKKNHYPSFFEINIYCNDNSKIIYEEIESEVNSKNPIIRIYAINEEAYSFITGVHEDFITFINQYIEESNKNIILDIQKYLETKNIKDSTEHLHFCQAIINNEYADLNDYILKFRTDAMINTSEISEYLPRRLLCDFSDYLIKITALKQKLALDLETVSSETDIALITKTNFKWVKLTNEII